MASSVKRENYSTLRVKIALQCNCIAMLPLSRLSGWRCTFGMFPARERVAAECQVGDMSKPASHSTQSGNIISVWFSNDRLKTMTMMGRIESRQPQFLNISSWRKNHKSIINIYWIQSMRPTSRGTSLPLSFNVKPFSDRFEPLFVSLLFGWWNQTNK